MDKNNGYFDNISGNHPQGGLSQQTSQQSPGQGVYGTPAPVPPRGEKGSGKGLFFGGMLTGIAGVLLILAVWYLGVSVQKFMEDRSSEPEQQYLLTEGSVIDENVIAKLQMLEGTIDTYFFLGDPTDEQLRDGIYKGLLNALGDPYSVYYSSEELTELMQQSEGVYYGIGAVMGMDTETSLPRISRIIKGSPAEDADLRADDLIYEVDGTAIYGMSLSDIVTRIKGPEDTKVTLTIIREGASDYLEVDLTRRKVESPTVEFKMLEEGMAYIQVTEFDDVSIKQFSGALEEAREAGMKGLILDLRGNPGGNVNAVVEMCRMILPKGLIVYTEDKYKHKSEYTCDGSNELEVPLVVLVDKNSASASEIMAGAIKDYGIGTLVGTTTYGKGIVQQIIPFPDGSAVKVTISAYYTPNGNNIHGIGIEPDVECPFDGEAYYGSEDHPDNQLEKGKEVLRELMGN